MAAQRGRENLWADVVSSIIIPKTSHPDTRACVRVASCGRGDAAGGVKAPEMRTTLDSPGGAQCHHKALIRALPHPGLPLPSFLPVLRWLLPAGPPYQAPIRPSLSFGFVKTPCITSSGGGRQGQTTLPSPGLMFLNFRLEGSNLEYGLCRHRLVQQSPTRAGITASSELGNSSQIGRAHA